MTREEKQKAIDTLKISSPFVAVTQEEFNNYIQTINQIIDWLEQEPTTKIEESNFSQEQYLADMQSAYDCGKAVIYKIRAEITGLRDSWEKDNYHDEADALTWALTIIDKYNVEKIKADMADIGEELRTRFDKYKADKEK